MSLFSKELRAALNGSLLVAAVALSGCRPTEQIARYAVPKPELIDPTLVAKSGPAAASVPQEMLGAIIVTGDTGWFFKLTADPESVQAQQEAFRSLVKSVNFATDGKPTWTLPTDWQELPGGQFRYATIRLPQTSSDGKPLEVTVSTAGGDVLANINRWRGQLNLKPIAADELSKTTETIKVGGHDCTLVRLSGTGGGGMSGAPFAGGAPIATTPSATGHEGKSLGSGIVFKTPKEWSAGARNQFRKAAFTVADGDKQAEITVIDLEPGSGDLLANVSRWRDQVGLSPITAAELAASVKKIETLGTHGDYVELVGPAGIAKGQTILGVMAAAGGRVWFVKLKGDSELAQREKPRFESFVKSLKLP